METDRSNLKGGHRCPPPPPPLIWCEGGEGDGARKGCATTLPSEWEFGWRGHMCSASHFAQRKRCGAPFPLTPPIHAHHMWPSEDPHRILRRKAWRSCRHDTCRARTGNGGGSCRNNRKLWTQLGGTVPNNESHHLLVCPSSTSTHYGFRFHSHHIDYYTILYIPINIISWRNLPVTNDT